MIEFRNAMPLKDYDSVSLAELLRVYFEEHYPVAYTRRLGDAIQVASYLHREDVRRGGRGSSVSPPYIEHPLRVAIRLFKYLGVSDPDTIIAAVLHDTVEDHAKDFADFAGVPNRYLSESLSRVNALDFISDHFGYGVAAIVEDVSNPILHAKPSKEEKILQYQEHVRSIAGHSQKALILKFSDFVDNAGSLHHHYAYDDKKVQYFVDRYAPLIPVYRDALNKSNNESFHTGAALERLEDVRKQFDKFQGKI